MHFEWHMRHTMINRTKGSWQGDFTNRNEEIGNIQISSPFFTNSRWAKLFYPLLTMSIYSRPAFEQSFPHTKLNFIHLINCHLCHCSTEVMTFTSDCWLGVIALLCSCISTCCSILTWVRELLWPAAVLGMLVNNALVPLQAGTDYRSLNNCKEKH